MKNLLIAPVAICAIVSTALAQQHFTTVQPQNAQPASPGYDPFQLDLQTGRFRYVPQPYDAQPAGSGYNPYQINWYSGQFDYVPVAPAAQAPAWIDRGGGNASNYIDTRVSPRTTSGPQNTIPSSTTSLPPPLPATYSIHPAPKPATAPTKPPATQPASESLGRVRSARDLANGRWEFDYSRGKWVYVLPPDK